MNEPSPGAAPTLAAGAGAGAAPPALGLGPAVLLLLVIISIHQFVADIRTLDLHKGSADERNANHEHPARNNSENPEEITEGHSQAVLGENAIEWVEVALVKRLGLPLLSRMKIREGLDSSGGSIQRLDASINWRRWCRDLENPERWWAGTPGIAKDWLVVAVEVCELWGSWVNRPQSCSLIESSLYTSAVAEAGLVAPSNKNPPLLWSRARGLDA